MQPNTLHSVFASVVITDSCWLWQGFLTPSGYGTVSIQSRATRVHRWVYERFVGEIPTGLTLDHLCRNKTFRLVGEPAMCPSIVSPTSVHGFCSAHERIYSVMNEFNERRNKDTHEAAVQWVREQGCNPADLRRIADGFDVGCVRAAR